ncbi:hypothetical protein EUTSA_v10005660mg [Eutrema salsugineum]|uniref:FBD domain-containing protein n=1 Tax=Eutrema salsugineum TaxID=72664 RepID=V4KNC9_EUTSA|nr:hypothetical protein EUTSA_v10005660mg [Eutrema salsugineum]
MMPKLKFDYRDHKHELGTFSNNVCTTLLSHTAPVIQKVEYQSGQIYRFPRTLYNFKTLETLQLRFNVLINVPSTVFLTSLRTLHLHYVNYKDFKSVLNLLSGCPNLKTLSVHRYPCSNTVKTFTIAVPSLQRLSIYNSNGGQQDWGYVINATSLKYLKIKGICGLGFCLIENVTELVEANITDVSDIFNENLVGSLTSVKRLSLRISPLKVKFPTDNVFYQLVHLELHACKEAWFNLLTLMLVSSPKLQVLKLINQWRCEKKRVARGEWNQPNNVSECLLFHLEAFMWKGYKWQREDEKEVAKYIIGNTKRLKRATFSSRRIKPSERVEVVKELESVVRASNSCKLVFE